MDMVGTISEEVLDLKVTVLEAIVVVVAIAAEEEETEELDLKLQWISSTVHPFPRL